MSVSAGNGNGTASAQGFANVGLLGGNAAASGCLGGLFQQPCITGGTYTEFYDTVQITGAPAGTQVSITFTLTSAVNLMGEGSGGWQTRFTDGFNEVENAYTAYWGSYGGDVLQTRSWTATYTAGNSIQLSGWLNLSVTEENCPGGSENCGRPYGLAASVTVWTPSAKIAHCPGCKLVSASGFNYNVAAQTHPFASLHTFDGADGASPDSALIQATDGNLYGTTQFGGNAAEGAVFKSTHTGVVKTVYGFCQKASCQDGEELSGGIIQASDGNLYGTTEFGGAHGLGSVFRLTRAGALTTLYSFDGSGGSLPAATLVQGSDGKLYGTTSGGGASLTGTFYRISRAGAFNVLHSFDAVSGSSENSAVIQGNDGNFYGTTYSGGTAQSGSAFKVDSVGALSTLYQFCSQPACTDGSFPSAPLLQAADGNLYGTTSGGGTNKAGTIFKLTPGGVLTTLYSFSGNDGSAPTAGLIQATDGNLYGTTSGGGAQDGGTIFRITPSGGFKSLYSFCSQSNCTDGSTPIAALTQATDGNLYGTTSSDATGFGTLFRYSLGLSPFVQVQTSSGAVGSTIVILGTNLNGATSVTFNGTAAIAFSVVSKSELKATIPAGATTGTVLVTTPGGTLSSNAPFTVN
ncbi:MAG: IPT/TIG domain-containing protein [Proteobacteria bacterium]|nr:IPT/TIG domain-containing protein [Pseudomonadota bacterium]